jgi:hypothetical protein
MVGEHSKKVKMSASRRSARKPVSGASALPVSVQRGLASMCAFDEDAVGKMISLRSSEPMAEALATVMRVNSISAEMLLARFFDRELLGPYCEQRLGKSGKGDAATLAARIAREWAKPTFADDRAAAPAEAAPACAKPADARSEGGSQKRQRSS